MEWRSLTKLDKIHILAVLLFSKNGNNCIAGGMGPIKKRSHL
jgi:hypothetical protein